MKKTKKNILLGTLTITLSAAVLLAGSKALSGSSEFIMSSQSIADKGIMLESVTTDSAGNSLTNISLGKNIYQVAIEDHAMIVKSPKDGKVISVNEQQDDNTYILTLNQKQRIQVAVDPEKNMLRLAGESAQ